MTLLKLWFLFVSVVLFYPVTGHIFMSPLNLNAWEQLQNEYSKALTDLEPADIQEDWIEQRLDHFDDNENRTWTMRYLEKLDYWKEEGPVYVFIGGEGYTTDSVLKVGPVNDLAKETDGALYATEHRFYGESVPFPDLKTEDLKFLSSRQALADLAHFIKTVRKPGSKVVVVGGSYAGNLAAWMRALYPDLVDAAISSSAPVLAKTDFSEYMEVVSNDYKRFGTLGCVEKITKIFAHFAQSMKTDEGIDQLKKEQNICEETNMHDPLNQQWFFYNYISRFQYYSQYGDSALIKRHCEIIKNLTDTASHLELLFSTHASQNNCISYDYRDLFILINPTMLAWTYQTCTEFGYFQTLTSKKQIFTNNLHVDLFIEICKHLYGSNFNEDYVDNAVVNTNKFYGGLKPNVTKVVFINGDMDPWSRLGITHDLSPDAPSKFIKRSSHCKDLHPDKDDDEPELKETRKFVKATIKKWIGRS